MPQRAHFKHTSSELLADNLSDTLKNFKTALAKPVKLSTKTYIHYMDKSTLYLQDLTPMETHAIKLVVHSFWADANARVDFTEKAEHTPVDMDVPG